MSKWKDVSDFLYGDMRTDEGFWYSHPLWEIDGLTEEQLYWVPDPGSLCIIWHVGHIALHVGVIKHLRALVEGKRERAC